MTRSGAFDWRRYAYLVALGLAAVLTLLLGARGIGAAAQVRQAAELAAAAGGEALPAKPAAAQPGPGPDAQAAQAIVKRNLFSPPAPGVRLTAVLGDKAYFSNGQSGMAGANLGTVKVLEVGPGWAKVEIEGREQQMHVFGPSALGGGAGVPGLTLPPGVQLPPELRARIEAQLKARGVK